MKKHINEFCNRYGLTEDQFLGTDSIGGSLDLSSLTSIPEGFNPTVGGSIDLSSLTSIPEGFNPTVGGYLYLSSLTSIPEGFNPTVGGSLDLSSLTSIPEGFNPTVGGSLYLSSLTSIPEGFNPTVGGYLFWKNGRKRIGANVHVPRIKQAPLQWQGGKYMSVDGVFTEVVERRANVFRVRHIGKKDIEYLVTDGNGAWAHGATLDDARNDLLYKMSERSVWDLNGLGLEDEMDFAQAVAVYRTVTGACAAGCKSFVGQHGIDTAKRYTLKDMLALTSGAYGHGDLRRFADSLNQ